MAEVIIDGIGSAYAAQVDNTNRLLVRTEGISVGSVSVSAGSESWIKGGSISVYNQVQTAGSIYSMPAVSVTAGSEQWIQNTVEVSGAIDVDNLYAGSETWVKNLYLGSSVWQGERFGVSGIVEVSNRVAGSIVNIPAVDINNPATIGSYTTQEVLGSVAITSPINVSVGSESWIKGGSIEVTTGSIHVTNFSAGTGYAGSDAFIYGLSGAGWVGLKVDENGVLDVNATVESGSDSFITNWDEIGSSRVVTNFGDLGSDRTISNRVAGSIVNIPSLTGSFAITNSVEPGSIYITNYENIGGYAGSEQWIQNVVEVSGSKLSDLAGSFAITNLVEPGSIYVTNYSELSGYAGSKVYQGDRFGVSGIVEIGNFNDLGSSSVVTNFGALGSSRVITNVVEVSGGIFTGGDLTGSFSTKGIGSIVGDVDINSPTTIGSFTKVSTYTGSIVAASGFGSKALPSMQNVINWISVQGLNNGSFFYFGIKDDEDYLISSSRKVTGDFSFLSPICISGVPVFTVSGAEVDGDYNFRITYE